MSYRGIDIREAAGGLLFRAFLQDSAGAILATGTTTLRLYELQTDGTLKSYDFNDDTFKAGALTTPTLAMTHRTGNNSTVNTGIWTVGITTLTGFTAGSIYFAAVNNSGASPTDQVREFQYGSGVLVDAADLVGDTGITLAKGLEMLAAFAAGKVAASSADGVTTYTYKKRDGSTTSFTAACSETDGTRATTGSLS